jgi:hypothetical protein
MKPEVPARQPGRCGLGVRRDRRDRTRSRAIQTSSGYLTRNKLVDCGIGGADNL